MQLVNICLSELPDLRFLFGVRLVNQGVKRRVTFICTWKTNQVRLVNQGVKSNGISPSIAASEAKKSGYELVGYTGLL